MFGSKSSKVDGRRVLLLLAVVGMCSVGYSQRAATPADGTPIAANRAATSSAASSTTPQTRAAIPTPAEYVVGEADSLHISVWKEPELTTDVVVRPDGDISMSLAGDVRASGMTPKQIEKVLADRLSAYILNPQVHVNVTEIRSKVVYVTGEVNHPGGYPLLFPTTVLQILARAGGLTQFAHKNKVFVLRASGQSQERFEFNYQQVLKGTNPAQNIILQPGDTIVVP